VEFAFDGDIHTKWVDYSGGEPTWVNVALPSDVAVTTYGIVSGNDRSDRDPTDWVLSGSADGGESWVVLDSQQGVIFSDREERLSFPINDNGASYGLYQFNVSAVAGGAETALMQISELELWYGQDCHDPCCGQDCSSHGTCDRTTGLCRCVAVT